MKKLNLILFLATMHFYNAQSLKDFDLHTPTFDLENYNQNKSESGQYTFYLNHDLDLERYEYHYSNEQIWERITKSGDPYSILRVYYPSGRLHHAWKRFDDLDIGVTTFYDEQGKIIKEINNESFYNFKIEDLIKKIKEEYGIDLNTTKQYFEIERNRYCDQQSIYTVCISPPENSVNRDGYKIEGNSYRIDGNTGKTLNIIEKNFLKSLSKLRQNREVIEVRPSDLWRKYEIDNKDEVLKITEYYTFGPACGLPVGLISEVEDDRPFEEKIIYEISDYQQRKYEMNKENSYDERWSGTFSLNQFEEFCKKNNAFP